MQRIVKWTEDRDRFERSGYELPYLGGAHDSATGELLDRTNDEHHGAVFALDLIPDSLANWPELRDALSHEGKVGRIISHGFEKVSGRGVWTFVVEFD